MKFLVDNQLPPALARFIQYDLGVEAVHVQDVNLENASDVEVWRYASQQGWTLISKDENFVDLYIKSPSTSLLWVRIRNCRRAELLLAFQNMWPRIVSRFGDGEQFIEIR